MRNEKELDAAFEIFFNSDCDSVFTARKLGRTHALWRQCPDNKDYQCLYDYRNRPRRQDIDRHYPLICETGATYIVEYDVFKEVKDFIGKKPDVYLEGSHMDIDTEEDFEKAAEIILKRNAQ